MARPRLTLRKLNIVLEFVDGPLFGDATAELSTDGINVDYSFRLANGAEVRGCRFRCATDTPWLLTSASGLLNSIACGPPYFHQGWYFPAIVIQGNEYFFKGKPCFVRWTKINNVPDERNICPIIQTNSDREENDGKNWSPYAKCVEKLIAIYVEWNITEEQVMHGVVCTPHTATVVEFTVNDRLVQHVREHGYTPYGLPESVCRIYRPRRYEGAADITVNPSYRRACTELLCQFLGRVDREIKGIFPAVGRIGCDTLEPVIQT